MIASSVRPASHRIVSVSIIGGFLDGMRFEFLPGLNCFIGARGSGKTTMVELIRYALDALPSRDTHAAEYKRIETLVESNLAGGRVQVAIETRDGLQYVISRVAGEDPMVLTPDGKATDITLNTSGLFRADIYSQNEVESIAERNTSQLQLLDSLDAASIASVNSQIAQVRAELEANAHQIVPLEVRIAAMGEDLATLVGVDERLQKFASDSAQNSEEINQAHKLKGLRDRERRILADEAEFLRQFEQSLFGFQGKVRQYALSLSDPDVLAGPNAALIKNSLRLFDECGSGVDWLARETTIRIAKALDQLKRSARQLDELHKEQELAFRQTIERYQHAQSQAAERSQLERRRNDLLAKQRQRDAWQGQLTTLQQQRTTLLNRQSELLDERFALRSAVVRRINDHLAPTICVTIKQSGNPERYLRLLEESLKTARVRHLTVSQRICAAFCPSTLAEVIRQRDVARLVEHAELGIEQADKVLTALSRTEFLMKLDVVPLLDLPSIQLRDGERYKDSSALSTGQKCTTILPILLLDSENPLLIDQPEDNLDNRFVFEVIVDIIRKAKSGRQMIFVTHNPNIPVLGDAERVFVLDSDGSTSRKACEGNVDECKKSIVTLLEGGEDAFKARKVRYDY
jgi:ABC-type lipoprotein export system ATPase subunit